jgi:hypothetical protein
VRNVLHVCEGGRGCCSHSCDTVRSETSTRMRAARHESAVLPTNGFAVAISRTRMRICGSIGQPSGRGFDRRSIGGEANHDAIARRCSTARVPTPCASSARFEPSRSKTVGRASGGAGAWLCASHRRQLLPQRQVLQDQFPMSAECQRLCAGDRDEQLQHTSIAAGVGAKINGDEFWRGSVVVRRDASSRKQSRQVAATDSRFGFLVRTG